MKKIWLMINVLIFCISATLAQDQVLIVQDEKEQMLILADNLKKGNDLDITLADQNSLAGDLSEYHAIISYIHNDLSEEFEKASIEYTENGGRLIVLHHSISSHKAKNKYYLDFLGIRLDNISEAKNPVEPGGGYGWVNPVSLTFVNLNSNHFITSHQIAWGDTVMYKSSDEPSIEKEYPAFKMENTEAYMNHKFTDGQAKIVLLGFKFYDERNKITFMQDRAAWIKKAGKGHIIYFQPGHSELDFKNPNFCQMILNAIIWEE